MKGTDYEQQYRQAVMGVFGTELGRWLLKEMAENTAYPFDTVSERITSYRLGQQELVQRLINITEGK